MDHEFNSIQDLSTRSIHLREGLNNALKKNIRNVNFISATAVNWKAKEF